MKIKPWHGQMVGILTLESDPFLKFISAKDGGPAFPRINMLEGDLGIRIAEDGRVWICINGVSFIRFKPSL